MLVLSECMLYFLVGLFVLVVFFLFDRRLSSFDHWLDESEDNDV